MEHQDIINLLNDACAIIVLNVVILAAGMAFARLVAKKTAKKV